MPPSLEHHARTATWRPITVLLLLMIHVAVTPLSSPVYSAPGDPVYGARSTALGRTGVAAGLGPSSIFVNPASAALPGTHGLEIGYTSLYCVPGVFDGELTASYGFGRIAVGFGWHQRRMEDLYHEDKIFATFAASPPGEWLSAGISLTGSFSHLSRETGFDSDPSPLLNIDAGAIFDLGRLGLGLCYANAAGGKYTMLEDGGIPYEIDPVLSAGVRLDLGERLAGMGSAVLLADLCAEGEGPFEPRAGVECGLYDVLYARVGVMGGDLSTGAGIRAPWFSLDITVIHDEVLDDTYQFSIRLPAALIPKEL